MEESEKLYIASKYFEKGYSYDQLHYGDDLYGRESFAEEIWDIIDEIRDIGRDDFKEKYKNYKLYF